MSVPVPQQTFCAKCKNRIEYASLAYFELLDDRFVTVCSNCTTIHGVVPKDEASSFTEIQAHSTSKAFERFKVKTLNNPRKHPRK